MQNFEMKPKFNQNCHLGYFQDKNSNYPPKRASHRYKISVIQTVSSKNKYNPPRINSPTSYKRSLKKIAHTDSEFLQNNQRYQNAHKYSVIRNLAQCPEQNEKISIKNMQHAASVPKFLCKANSLNSSKNISQQYFSKREIQNKNSPGYLTEQKIKSPFQQKQILREHFLFSKATQKNLNNHMNLSHNSKNISSVKTMQTHFKAELTNQNSRISQRKPQNLENLLSQTLTNNIKLSEESLSSKQQQIMEIPIVKINRNAKHIRQFKNTHILEQPQEWQSSSSKISKAPHEQHSSSSKIYIPNFLENQPDQTEQQKVNTTQKIRQSTNNSKYTESDLTTIYPDFLVIQPLQQLFLCRKCKEYLPTIQIKFHQANCSGIKEQIQLTNQENKQIIFANHQAENVFDRKAKKQRFLSNCIQFSNKSQQQLINSQQKLYKLAQMLKVLSELEKNNFSKIKIKINDNSILKEKYVSISSSSFVKYKVISSHLLDYLGQISKPTFFLRSQNTIYKIMAVIGIMTPQQCILDKQELFQLITNLISTIQNYIENNQTKNIRKPDYFEAKTPYFCFF